MKSLVKHILLLITGMLSASCIYDADQCIMPADEPRSVMFTVSLDGPQTRAAWPEEYQDTLGVPFDFRIDPDGLRVVVLAADNTRLGTVQDLYYFPTNDSHTQFQFMGQMPEGFVEHFNNPDNQETEYKFMVLANCGDNLSGEQYITYNYSQLDPAAEDSSIPMWGVAQADLSPLIEKQSLGLGDIWLLRAAAKIEVKLSDRLKEQGVSIASSMLKYYNQTGYCLPEGWSQTNATSSLDQENCIRVYRHTAINLPFVEDEETGNYYTYVCEYDNINYPGERNKISLEFDMGGEIKAFEDAISFCQYSGGLPLDGKHYNIVRNHIYEFEILSIAGDNLMLEYTVADWDAEEWKDDVFFEEHDLTYPNYHNPVVPEEFFKLSASEQTDYQIQTEPTMYYSGEDNNLEPGGFECFFQITSPENVEWKPGFMGTKENYRMRVYRYAIADGSQTLVFDSGVEGLQANLGISQSNEWFRIVIFPLSNEGAGTNEIDFGISYYQAWTDQYINLFVNGEYGNIRWPESGDNPKVITIKHITDPSAGQADE